MAATLYVSNPRKRSARRRGNPERAQMVLDFAPAKAAAAAAPKKAAKAPANPTKKRSGGRVAKRKISAAHLAKMQAGRRRWLKAGGKAGKKTGTKRTAAKAAAAPRRRTAKKAGAKRTGTRRTARTSKRRTGQRKYLEGRFVPRKRSSKRRKTKRNSLALSNPLVISNPLGGIPIIGTMISLVGPAAMGAGTIELTGQAYKMAGEWIPEGARKYVAPVQYTLGGLIFAGIIQLCTFIPAPLRHSVSLAAASAGGGVDLYRYRSASGAYGDYGDLALGDGGNWSVDEGEDLGDDDALGDLALGDYAGDEDYCDDDFSVEEGHAAAESFGAYHRKFPHERGSWHWLAAAFGPEELVRLANMPPKLRVRTIAACKAAVAQEAGPRQIAENNMAGDEDYSDDDDYADDYEPAYAGNNDPGEYEDGGIP